MIDAFKYIKENSTYGDNTEESYQQKTMMGGVCLKKLTCTGYSLCTNQDERL